MRNKVSVYFLLTSFLLWGLYACVHEETDISSSDKSNHFFDASGGGTDIQYIASMLKQKNDSAEYVPQFIETYGYPMWKKAVTFLTIDAQVYLVPVRNQDPNKEIEAIWYFTIGTERTHYNIYTKEMADAITRQVGNEIEQTWLFDYFTQSVLHKKPASGLFFRDIANEIDTRTPVVWITCTDAYITIEEIKGPEGTEHTESVTVPKGRLCVVEAYEGFDSSGDGSDGSGGDLGNPPGSGGGSKHNNNDPDSPCDRAESLSNDAALKAKVNELFQTVHNEQAGFAENGWTKTTNGEYIYPSSRDDGSMSYNPSDLTGKKTTEQYHCHPGSGACYPSMSDLENLATRYKNGNIDVKNFTYGVISSYGCLSIMITSEDAFKTFTNKVLNKDIKLNNDYNDMHIEKVTSADMSVAKFIDFLKLSVSGLNVIFNEPSFDSNGTPSLGNWTAKNSGGNANLSNYNCH